MLARPQVVTQTKSAHYGSALKNAPTSLGSVSSLWRVCTHALTHRWSPYHVLSLLPDGTGFEFRVVEGRGPPLPSPLTSWFTWLPIRVLECFRVFLIQAADAS